MTFPITHIKTSGDIELTSALETLVEEKLGTLQKFVGGETDMTCNVELEKMTASQSGNIWRAEVNLYLKGKMFRSESTTDQIEKSIDEVRDELYRELERANDKSQTLRKKGGAAVKQFMQFGE